MTQILVVEDGESYRESLVYQLEREGYSVVAVADGLSAVETYDEVGADLVLLDLMLPGLSGIEVCRELRRRGNVPVIMLTAKDSEIDKVVGLEIGADDYVTKPYSFRELLARMRAVLRRHGAAGAESSIAAAATTTGVSDGDSLAAVATPAHGFSASEDEVGDDILTVGSVVMDVDRHTVHVRDEAIAFPLKEFELLEYLMRNGGRVLTRGQLIDRVWGLDYVGDTKTLDVHVKRIRAKVEVDPGVPRFLLTVRGLGYKLADEPVK